MAKAKTIAAIKAEIAKHEKDLREAREREAHRLGLLVLDAGFEDIEASERDLKEAFREAARRFREGPSGTAQGA